MQQITDDFDYATQAQRQADELGLAWAKRVAAEAGVDPANGDKAVIVKALREADRKRRYLRAYILLADQLRDGAGADDPIVYAVWQLNDTTGERTFQDVFTLEDTARDYIEAHRDSFDDTCLYIKPSRLTPA